MIGGKLLEKLCDIANISLGAIISRKKAKSEIEIKAKYKMFSMKCYEDNLKKNEYEDFSSNDILNDKIVKEGDLIFRLLYPLKVAYVTKELEGLLVPSQYCIVRLTDPKYDATFLKWYLESSEVDKQVVPFLMNTVMPLITVKSLKQIEIPKVNIEKQRNIGKIIIDWQKEKQLIKQLQTEKEKYYYEIIKKSLGENNGE